MQTIGATNLLYLPGMNSNQHTNHNTKQVILQIRHDKLQDAEQTKQNVSRCKYKRYRTCES